MKTPNRKQPTKKNVKLEAKIQQDVDDLMDLIEVKKEMLAFQGIQHTMLSFFYMNMTKKDKAVATKFKVELKKVLLKKPCDYAMLFAVFEASHAAMTGFLESLEGAINRQSHKLPNR